MTLTSPTQLAAQVPFTAKLSRSNLTSSKKSLREGGSFCVYCPVFANAKEYIDILSRACEENNIPYHAGTYLQLKGPNYETPAEIRMAQTIGVDAVGMSTVCEVIAARYLNLKVAGISCITNMAAGISKTMLNHKEVLEVTEKNKVNFKVILRELISKM